MRVLKDFKGFTLVEVMVALAIAGIMMLGVFQVFIAQKNLFSSTDTTVQLMDNARIALDSIQRDLIQAGFGVDPGLAFPFLDINTWLPANFDLTDGPDTLQFLVREKYPLPGANDAGCPAITPDPSRRFYWSIVSANSGTGITLRVCPGFQLPKGAVLLAMCSNGGTYAYMRYLGNTIPSSFVGAEVNVTLNSSQLQVFYSVVDRTYPAGANITTLDNSCFLDGYAGLYRINVYRYFIRPSQIDAGTGIEVVPPYLMLDMGMDINEDNVLNEDDQIPVSEGIEDMQVVYTFFNGNTAGCPTCTFNEVENNPNYTNIYRPVYCDDLYSQQTCITGGTSARSDPRPGNTISVRVTIVARSAVTDPTITNSFPLSIENHIIPLPLPRDGYRRIPIEITVPIVNTLAEKSFPYL